MSKELRDVWVVVQGWASGLSAHDQGALAKGREIADMLGCYLRVLMLGTAEGTDAIALGADSVAMLDMPVYAEPGEVVSYACGELFTENEPEFILFSSGALADEMAPTLAACLDAGLIAPCLWVMLDEDTRSLRVAQPAYDGLYQIPVRFLPGRTQIVVLGPDALGIPMRDDYRSGDVFTLAGREFAPGRVRTLGPADEHVPPRTPLVHARAVVALGRGLGDQAGLELAWRLAELLDADLAGDSTARELGWVDEAHTIGLTGEVIAPALYVGLGVRGDDEHTFGMAESRLVVALHADAHAPIFKRAQVGLVGDVQAGVRALIAALERPSA